MNADARAGKKGEPGKRRWLWPVLIVSLGLNLLFVGLVAGRIWMHGGGGPGAHNRVFIGAVEALMKDLPAAKREKAGALLERHRTTLRQLRKQLREQRRVAKDAVLTEPYDAAKVSEVFARFRELRTGQHQSMHTMMIDLLKDLTLKEREQLVKNIRAGFRHRWGHRHRPNGPQAADPPPERQ